jgi:hypothetical protein
VGTRIWTCTSAACAIPGRSKNQPASAAARIARLILAAYARRQMVVRARAAQGRA